jgi:hypothetical protein
LSNGLLVSFFSFKSLLFREFQGFQVVSNNTEFFFKLNDLAETGI